MSRTPQAPEPPKRTGPAGGEPARGSRRSHDPREPQPPQVRDLGPAGWVPSARASSASKHTPGEAVASAPDGCSGKETQLTLSLSPQCIKSSDKSIAKASVRSKEPSPSLSPSRPRLLEWEGHPDPPRGTLHGLKPRVRGLTPSAVQPHKSGASVRGMKGWSPARSSGPREPGGWSRGRTVIGFTTFPPPPTGRKWAAVGTGLRPRPPRGPISPSLRDPPRARSRPPPPPCISFSGGLRNRKCRPGGGPSSPRGGRRGLGADGAPHGPRKHPPPPAAGPRVATGSAVAQITATPTPWSLPAGPQPLALPLL